MAKNRVISAVLTLKDKDFSTNAKKATSATKEMERKMKHANNTVKSFGKSATSSFKSIANSAIGMAGAIGITKAFSSAFGMVKGSISSAFDRIDTMEQFRNVMEVMTGSTVEANKALETTRDIVKGTAFGLDTAAGAVQGFVTGGMKVEDATRIMGSFTDAVAFYTKGTNEELGTVTDALIKMSTKGKVNMQQLGRIIEAGIPAIDIYAEAMNMSTTEVTDAISKGKIEAASFMDVMDEALANGTEKFPALEGAAKKAGASWRGTFDNMRAAVTRGTMSIIQSIDDMLKNNGLPDMRSIVASFGSKFESVLNSAADKIPVVTGFLVGMYESAKPGLDWLKDTAMPAVQEGIGFVTDKAKEMYDFITNNWSLISPIVAGLTATVAAFKLGIVAITAAKATWAAVTSGVQIATALLNGALAISPLGWVALAIGAVVMAGIALWQNWDTVKEKAGELWEKTKEVFGGIYDWAVEKIQPVTGFFQSLYNRFVDFKTAISSFSPPEWVMKIGGAIGTATAKVGKFISGSHATGLDRVPYDGYLAELHKDEMVVPATQSRKLRSQGLTINNIDKGMPTRPQNTTTQFTYQTTNISNSELPQLIRALMDLINMLKDMPKGDVNIQIDGYNKSVNDIINELVPALKLRLANM